MAGTPGGICAQKHLLHGRFHHNRAPVATFCEIVYKASSQTQSHWTPTPRHALSHQQLNFAIAEEPRSHHKASPAFAMFFPSQFPSKSKQILRQGQPPSKAFPPFKILYHHYLPPTP